MVDQLNIYPQEQIKDVRRGNHVILWEKSERVDPNGKFTHRKGTIYPLNYQAEIDFNVFCQINFVPLRAWWAHFSFFDFICYNQPQHDFVKHTYCNFIWLRAMFYRYLSYREDCLDRAVINIIGEIRLKATGKVSEDVVFPYLAEIKKKILEGEDQFRIVIAVLDRINMDLFFMEEQGIDLLASMDAIVNPTPIKYAERVLEQNKIVKQINEVIIPKPKKTKRKTYELSDSENEEEEYIAPDPYTLDINAPERITKPRKCKRKKTTLPI